MSKSLEKKCKACNHIFTTTNLNRVYCSLDCRELAQKQLARARKDRTFNSKIGWSIWGMNGKREQTRGESY